MYKWSLLTTSSGQCLQPFSYRSCASCTRTWLCATARCVFEWRPDDRTSQGSRCVPSFPSAAAGVPAAGAAVSCPCLAARQDQAFRVPDIACPVLPGFNYETMTACTVRLRWRAKN
eukprot:scpid98036/ scgid2290/ 